MYIFGQEMRKLILKQDRIGDFILVSVHDYIVPGPGSLLAGLDPTDAINCN
jgi:hypothetical protein